MKIRKTSSTGSTSRTAPTRDKGGASKSSSSQKEVQPVEDTVELSNDAISAAKTAAVSKTSDATEADGPLPDPRETARAILEKELAKVFKETYL